jgi:hypothetical protein
MGELPSEGAERRIFLVALARMSDQCSPPDLIAECPFAVDLPGGGRGCVEECEELLARYGPVPRADELTLSAGGMAARRRPRVHGPLGSAIPGRAFDALEIFYRESEEPNLARWSAVALVTGAARFATMRPEARTAEASAQLPAIIAELRCRGFDVDRLIRPGLEVRMVATMVGEVALATVRPGAGGESAASIERLLELRDATLAADGASALELTGDRGESEDANVRQVVASTVARLWGVLAVWAACATWDDLLAWSVRTGLSSDGNDGESGVSELGNSESVWIFDRFTETFLEHWDDASLRLEWQYEQELIEAPVPEREMSARHVDRHDLADRVADLAVSRDARQLRDQHLTRAAVDLLVEGHRRAAVALFDAVRQSDPDDSLLLNNYAFCLLPDDTAAALVHLNRAAELGLRLTVNLANRMLALYWLGRPAAALELAERALDSWEHLDRTPSYLWNFESPDPSDPALLKDECPRCYVVRLAAAVAASTQDRVLATQWARRAEKLVHEL